MELIFEKSRPGRRASSLPPCDVPEVPVRDLLDKELLRDSLDLPEVAEIDLVRHYTAWPAQLGVDLGFYPLGSCTMKYNPKIHENLAALVGFAGLHPYTPRRCARASWVSCTTWSDPLRKSSAWPPFPSSRRRGPRGTDGHHDLQEAFREERGTAEPHPHPRHGPWHQPRIGSPVRLPDRDGSQRRRRRRGSGAIGVPHGRGLCRPHADQSQHPGLFERRIEEVAAVVHRKEVSCTATGPTPTPFWARPVPAIRDST
jgi:glycine dehydrogenase subunit 2